MNEAPYLSTLGRAKKITNIFLKSYVAHVLCDTNIKIHFRDILSTILRHDQQDSRDSTDSGELAPVSNNTDGKIEI